jgi:hypothetical protein
MAVLGLMETEPLEEDGADEVDGWADTEVWPETCECPGLNDSRQRMT